MSRVKIIILSTGSAVMLTLLLLIKPAYSQHNKPVDTPSNYDTDDCLNLFLNSLTYNDAHKYNMGYDTAKEYIEHCYSEQGSENAFSTTTTSVVGLYHQGTIIIMAYRDWLKKVLYYNPDSNYYCTDLLQYAETFEFKDENNKPEDYKTTLAIFKYLIDSAQCSILRNESKNVLKGYYLGWKDTVRDSLKTPFDTNYSSLDDLGQTFLRSLARDVDVHKINSTVSLSELTAEKNPFTSEAVIHYITNAPTVAKLEVYDALGHMLWTNGQGYLEPGNHVASIDGSQWSSGTYYVRLVTLKGEIKTCKLIKE